MLNKIQQIWNRLQDLLDISGDVWMGLFTAMIIFRLGYAALGHIPLTAAEAGAYGSAIAAFGYSNRRKL